MTGQAVIDWIKVGVVGASAQSSGVAEGVTYASQAHGCEDSEALVREVLLEEAEALGFDVDESWVKEQSWRMLRIFEDAMSRSTESGATRSSFVYQMELPSGKTILMGAPLLLDQVSLLH